MLRDRIRILHVAETAKGGIGTYIDEIAPLQAAEFGAGSVRVIVPREHAAQLSRVPAAAITPFRRTGRGVANLIRLRRAFNAEVRAFAPDVIHAHSFFAGLVARLSRGRRSGAPVIVYCPHGWSFDIAAPGWQRRLLEHVERALSRNCAAVIAISDHEARQARRIGIPDDKIRQVTNGISAAPPPAVPARWDDDRLKILFVGRLDHQKGFDVLLAAVSGAPARFSVKAAGAAVAGGTEGKNIPDGVELLGWLDRSAIEGVLQQADMVVMPSRWEGFGLAALEAMRAGKPVVATRVGGLPEIVEDGVTGRLVPPEDPVALRHALLLDDEASRRRLGGCGRQRFLERFTAERTHRLLLDLYAELTRQPARFAQREAPAAASTATAGASARTPL